MLLYSALTFSLQQPSKTAENIVGTKVIQWHDWNIPMPSNELKHQTLQEQQQSLRVWASKAQISQHQQLEPPTKPTQLDELHVDPCRTPSN